MVHAFNSGYCDAPVRSGVVNRNACTPLQTMQQTFIPLHSCALSYEGASIMARDTTQRSRKLLWHQGGLSVSGKRLPLCASSAASIFVMCLRVDVFSVMCIRVESTNNFKHFPRVLGERIVRHLPGSSHTQATLQPRA